VILADTSIWIDHFRRGNRDLEAALDREEVMTHPFVVGELACGNLKKRSQVLAELLELPSAVVATNDEVMRLIEHRRLMGKGIGFIDAHLLASVALMSNARLWTLDRRLAPFAGPQNVEEHQRGWTTL
jgi:predicted nucleic acid-binding protein